MYIIIKQILEFFNHLEPILEGGTNLTLFGPTPLSSNRFLLTQKLISHKTLNMISFFPSFNFVLGIFVLNIFISSVMIHHLPSLRTLPPVEGANLASFILLSIFTNIIVIIIIIIKIVKISACPWAADCGTALRLTSTGTFSFNSQSLPTFR